MKIVGGHRLPTISTREIAQINWNGSKKPVIRKARMGYNAVGFLGRLAANLPQISDV